MGADYRRLALEQGSRMATTYVASRIRSRRLDLPPSAEEPDRPALQAAEELIGRRATAEGPEAIEVVETPGAMMIPDDLFDQVEDREEAKAVLFAALRSEDPVHVLLEGDPASGKSQLLSCIARLPQSRYAVGGMTTSSGLVEYLTDRPNTRFLLIDELEKSDPRDHYALYSLMESGLVTRLKHDAREESVHRVWVIAACNRSDRLPEALRSRFVLVRLEAYSPFQVEEIATAVLTKREGLPPARAREIARAVAKRSRDPRDAVQVARLAGQSGSIEAMLDQVIPRTTRRSGVSSRP